MRDIKGRLIESHDFGPFGIGCAHAVMFPDKCVQCYYCGKPNLQKCDECGATSWHLDNKCVRHDSRIGYAL